MRRRLCRHALSPLLGGPFLIFPSCRQSATPGSNQPPRDFKSQRHCRSRIRRYLRDTYEARSPPETFTGRQSCHNNTTPPPSIPPAGLLAIGFYCISTHQVFHTTLSSVAGHRLSTRAHLQILSSEYCNQPADHLPLKRSSPMSLTCIRMV